MKNKAYNPNLKRKYDQVGKNFAKEIMNDCFRAEHIRDNEAEDSGDFSEGFWDQIYRLSDKREIAIEPEIKDKKWFGEHFIKDGWRWPFKYPTIDIPYRKNKNKATLHMVISSCGNHAVLVTRKAMNESVEQNGPKVKKTIWEPNGAPYYSVPLGKSRFVFKDKTTGRWRLENG